MVFAGVGFVAFPLDLIRDFIGRPKATITHSEYIKRAKALGARAKAVKVIFLSFMLTQRDPCSKGLDEMSEALRRFKRVQKSLMNI